MQHQIGIRQHIGQWFVFPTAYIVADGFTFGNITSSGFQMLNHGGQKAASTTSRVEQGFPMCGFNHIGHELGNCARGIELAQGTRALQLT